MVNIVTAQPVNNAGFSHANAAFTAPTSGVSGVGSLSGPFWIQEQTMDYDYARVPLGFLSSVALSLSGATWTSTHTGTVLLVRATANVNTRKSYEWFSTSSYQQGQRFSVEAASADQFGNTYCNVTPSDCDISSFSGTYGVAGRIYTSQNGTSESLGLTVSTRKTIKHGLVTIIKHMMMVDLSQSTTVLMQLMLN